MLRLVTMMLTLVLVESSKPQRRATAKFSALAQSTQT